MEDSLQQFSEVSESQHQKLAYCGLQTGNDILEIVLKGKFLLGEMMMRRTMGGFVFALILLTAAACSTPYAHRHIDAASIPDGTYDVYRYRGNRPLKYAVLFDIPDDGMPVVMFHSYLTKHIGLDSPAQYINFFENRVGGYKTLEITDRAGTVRGYLLMSNFIYYQIDRREAKILVWIERTREPILDGRD